MPENELKNRVRFSTTLDKSVSEKLKGYSRKTMIPISKLMDVAILSFIESREQAEKTEK